MSLIAIVFASYLVILMVVGVIASRYGRTMEGYFLADRGLVDGKPAAYVCEHYACRLPVNTPQELSVLLGD